MKPKRISEVYDVRVFTDAGVYFGDIEECILTGNRVAAWRIKATKISHFNNVLGGAKEL